MPVVNGNQFANTLQGDQDPGDPNDTINGFGGDDTLSGGGGNNQLNGGFDTDTADYTFVSPIFGPPVSGVNVDLAAGTATNPFGGTDALSGIEDVIGTDAADTIRGDGNDNRLEGRGGGDTLEGRGGADTLLGQAGADSLDGGAGDDSLDGGAGNDTLVGGPGVDTATGGPGNDVFRFGPGDLAPIFPPFGPFDRITDFEGAGLVQSQDPADRIEVDTASGMGVAAVNPSGGSVFLVAVSDGFGFSGVLEVFSVSGNPPVVNTDIVFV